MRRYSEAVKADMRRRIRPPHRQSLTQISADLGIHADTLYNRRKGLPLQGEVAPASKKEPESFGATDKFPVVLVSAGLNAIELSAYGRGRGLFLEQVVRLWRAFQDANENQCLPWRIGQKSVVKAALTLNRSKGLPPAAKQSE